MPKVAVLVLAVLLAGCAMFSQSLEVTGTSILGVGEQFEAVSAQVVKGCANQAIPKTTCDRYRVFGENFKRTYPLTVGLWDSARKAGDAKSQGKAEDVIRSLAVDLSKLAVEALGAFAPEVK